ncbi:ribonuclease Th1 [Trichophyton equinum CBS 127.97]|uniref:ribonuclease T1 n=1 Tax=Trichophyton equinum (strain ATCC MYA-4606 / CBS 127.97) TaxID=559882 RepID=F2PXX0_TRIEC|nr:ribonuclease Th1 [Trichophyton equinum CBS 127.97]
MKLLSILTFAAAVSAIKCGRNVYSEKQVKDADAAACNHVQGHTRAGKYPHVYKNHEGFTFNGLKGPFFEFPLLNSGIYKRGSPGPDRVIITQKCERAGEITHTGAKRGGFVACSGTT